ncbi:MAG: SagB/ThcOx family dehydrogenase [Muribaculaceae bacterium]|nr:SagB/ThcOx family dehydrogenase [Muribaculaceae bacterium]
MRKIFLFLLALAAMAVSAQDIVLIAPETDKGCNVMEAFTHRRSTREFDTKELSLQDMSNLLWATMGINSDDRRLTAPSCRNKQEIRLFVVTGKGAYEYMPTSHILRHITDGDFRPVIAGEQTFVNDAPICLVMVADMDKFGSTDKRAMTMAAVDAGIVIENACLAAAGLGLATVPRASMDSKRLQQLLGLNENQIPLMNAPVGYFTK